MAETVRWSPVSLTAARATDVARETVAPADAADGELSYLLVEEIVRGQAHLQRWPWPEVDRDGRLTWSKLQPLGELVIGVDLLRWQLYQPQVDGLRRRPRAGDVFAVRWSGGRRSASRVTDLRTYVTDAYDVSADAREAAKLAYLAVQSAQLDLPSTDDVVARPEAVAAPAPRLVVLPPPQGES